MGPTAPLPPGPHGWPVVPLPRVALRLKHGLQMILDPAPVAGSPHQAVPRSAEAACV